MTKRRLIVLGAAAVAAGVAVALFTLRHPGAPRAGLGKDQPFVVCFENDVMSFDTLKLPDIFALRVASQIYEGLARLDASNEIVPGVAASWSHSDDFTRWTFRIRQGVRFHPHPSLDDDSRRLTAEDVAYSFTRMLSKGAGTAGPLSSILKGAKEYQAGATSKVEGVRVVSADEIEFTLVRPDSLFPGRISSPAYGIVKESVIRAAGPDFGQTVAVGAGPYRFVARRGNDLVLRRYDEYWAGNHGPAVVVFRTIKEDAVRLAEARAGRLDVMYATAPMLPGLVERRGETISIRAEETSRLRIMAYPIFNTFFIAFNWPKMDRDLRRAIALAVDRQQVVDAVVPITGRVAPGPIPLACAGYKSQVAASRNLDAAREALAAYRTRVPGGTPRLRLLTHELAQSVPIGEVLQAQLREIGIETEIVQQSFNAVVGLLQKGDFEAVSIGYEYAYSLPQLMFETYLSSAAIPVPNVFQYSKPEHDAAIGALFRTADRQASLRAAAEVERRLVEDDPGVFLYQTLQVILFKPSIDGLKFNGANYPVLTEVKSR